MMIAIQNRANNPSGYCAEGYLGQKNRVFLRHGVRAACLGLCLFGASLQAVAAGAPPTKAAVTTTSTWTCQAFYLPARSIWQRTVAISYDGAVLRQVQIDGVVAYTFAVNGTSVMTAVDGERIQFDVAALTWASDLRGLVSASGRCTT